MEINPLYRQGYRCPDEKRLCREPERWHQPSGPFSLGQLGWVFELKSNGQPPRSCVLLTEAGMESTTLLANGMETYGCTIRDGLVVLASAKSLLKLLDHLHDRTGQRFYVPSRQVGQAILKQHGSAIKKKGLDSFVVALGNRCEKKPLHGIKRTQATGVILLLRRSSCPETNPQLRIVATE